MRPMKNCSAKLENWKALPKSFGDRKFRQEVMMDPEFTFAHFKINDGSATIGGALHGDKVYFGVALCSPEDNFSKKTGRALVQRHIVVDEHSSKRGVFVPSGDISDIPPARVLYHILNYHLGRLRRLPTWAKNPVVMFRTRQKLNK